MKELLKEKRKTKVAEWRDTVVVGSEVAQMELGLAAPKRRVISKCLKWEFFKQIRRKIRNPLANSRRRQKRRAVIRVESAETPDYVSAPPLTSGRRTSKTRRSRAFVPRTVSGPRRALHMCDSNKRLQVLRKYGHCARRRRSAYD